LPFQVSPRTIFAYFPSKEDIIFYDLPELQERLARALRERPRRRDRTRCAARVHRRIAQSRSERSALRGRIVASDETLRRNKRPRFAPLEQLTVEAIAEDLHAGPDDIRPQIVAAALIAAFNAVHDPTAPPESFSPQHAMAVIDEVIRLLHGGLEALRRPLWS
jgi:AcrR family transcriptional regulator